VKTEVVFLRSLSEALAIVLLGAIGLWLYIQLVLFLSRGMTWNGGSGLLAAGLVGAGVLLVVWVARKPEMGLYLFVLTFPLTNESFELPYVTVSLPNVLLVTMALGLLARRILGRPQERTSNPVFWPKFALLSWLVLATGVSALLMPQTDATLRFLITRAGYALTFLVILTVIDDTKRLKTVLRLMAWSAGGTAIVTILGGLFPFTFPIEVVRCNEPILPVLNTYRCTAFNLSFHAMGSWLLAGLPAILFSVKYPKLLGLPRKAALALAALCGLALVIGRVRGAWVALLVSLLVMALFAARPKKGSGLARFCYVGGALILGVALACVIWILAIAPIVSLSPDSFFARLESYKVAFSLFQQHWLFGLGPLDERFLALDTVGYGVIDNLFIAEIGATGLLGAIPFLLLWAGAFRSLIKIMEGTADSELRQLATILAVGVLFLLVAVQAYVAIGEKTPWILMGLAASLARIQRTRPAVLPTTQPVT